MSLVIDMSCAISTDIDTVRYKGQSWSSDQMQELYDKSNNGHRRKRRILPGGAISNNNPCLTNLVVNKYAENEGLNSPYLLEIPYSPSATEQPVFPNGLGDFYKYTSTTFDYNFVTYDTETECVLE